MSPSDGTRTFGNGYAVITGTLEANTAPSTFDILIANGGTLNADLTPALTAVPEPSPLVLLGLGVLPLALRARRRLPS